MKDSIKFKNGISAIAVYIFIYIILSNLASLAVYFLFYDNITKEVVEIAQNIQIAIDAIVLFLICFLCRKPLKDGLNDLKYAEFFINIFLYNGILYVCNIIVAMPAFFLTGGETSANQQAVESLLQTNTAYMLFSIVIFAPIVEELVFRGAIYGIMRKKFGVLISIFVSSMTFGLLHFTFSIINGDMSDLIFLVSYIAPAIIMCIAYEKTKNIYIPIILHFMNNFAGALAIINFI